MIRSITKSCRNNYRLFIYRKYFGSTADEKNKESAIPFSFLKEEEKVNTHQVDANENAIQHQPIKEMQEWAEKHRRGSEIIKQEDNEDGLERFRECLINMERYSKPYQEIGLAKSPHFSKLRSLIESYNTKEKAREEYKYEVSNSQEFLYKDVIYESKAKCKHGKALTDKFGILYAPRKIKKANISNYSLHNVQARELSEFIKPVYEKIVGTITTPIGNLTDVYKWVHNTSHELAHLIMEKEDSYSNALHSRFSLLQQAICSELDKYKLNPFIHPLPINDYMYFRNTTNDADFLTVYRYKDSLEKTPELDKSERVFSLEDVCDLYEKHGKENESVKNFIEQFHISLQQTPSDKIYNIQADFTDKYLGLSLFLEETDTNYYIMIKDIHANRLLPFVLPNTTGTIAFEPDSNSFYFVEKDIEKRPHKLYRFNIEKNMKSLIYEETNPNFTLDLEPSRSGEYIFLSISSVESPYTNEIWFKSAQAKSSFTLYDPMQFGVTYELQQSREYFIVKTNKDRPYHYLLKVKIPDELLFTQPSDIPKLGQKRHLALPPIHSGSLVKRPVVEQLSLNQQVEPEDRILKQIKDKQTPSKYFQTRAANVEAYTSLILSEPKIASLISRPEIKSEVYNLENKEETVENYQAFQHYIFMQSGEQSNSQLYVKSLVQDTQHKINLVSQPLYVTMEANYRYNTNRVMFTSYFPHLPEEYNEYNMSLQKLKTSPFLSYSQLDCSKFRTEKIKIKTRDEFEIQAHIIYNKEYFNEKSPAIIYTSGALLGLPDISFKPWYASALDRGCTLVFPETRGTLAKDALWHRRGILENKISHLTDFADVGIFLKANKLATKIAAIGEGISGCLTVAATMIKEPKLYDSVVLNEGVYDLATFMLSTKDNPLRQECGDISLPHVCKFVLSYSPYHMEIPSEIQTNILIGTNDKSEELRQHSYKFAGKLREFSKENIVLVKNYSKLSYNEKVAYYLGFLIKSLYTKE